MAEIVTDPEWRSSRPFTYPWDEWLDGQARKLISGEDFHVSSDSFRRIAYVAAATRGKKIRTRVSQGGSEVQLQAIRDKT